MNITQATHAASNRSRVRIVGGPLDGREGFATGWRPAHDSLLLSLLDSDGHNTWTNTPVKRRQVQLAAPARIPAPQPAAGPVPQTIATLITQTEAQGASRPASAPGRGNSSSPAGARTATSSRRASPAWATG